jgi:hypothetical protein
MFSNKAEIVALTGFAANLYQSGALKMNYDFFLENMTE